VLCDTCFGAQTAADRTRHTWLRLACFGGGLTAVFPRSSQPLFLEADTAKSVLYCTNRVYEALWGQGSIFEANWRSGGLIELSPLPASFQPPVRKLEETWIRYMHDYITLSAKDVQRLSIPTTASTTKASTRPSTMAISPPRCAAKSLDDLCGLEPLSTDPLIYMVPHFLSDAECDHFARVGYHRASPSSGGLMLALGSAEWAPCEATDALAAAVEERVGRLVGCMPHTDDGGFKLACARPHRHTTSHLRPCITYLFCSLSDGGLMRVQIYAF
jgi:hypothetical protein